MSWKADTLTPVCMRFAQADWGLGNYLPLRGWKTTTHSYVYTTLNDDSWLTSMSTDNGGKRVGEREPNVVECCTKKCSARRWPYGHRPHDRR